MNNIHLQVLNDGTGIALMDTPGRPFNVFSEDMMDDLETLITYAQSNLKGLVLGSSKSAFIAGADLTMIKSFADMRFDAEEAQMKLRFSRLGRLFRKLELLSVPVVAAINGLALGGGLELAMACHSRICIDTPLAILGLPEVQLGLLPGAGGTQRLPRYIGLTGALKMLLTGDPVTPAEAVSSGLIDRVCVADILIEQALQEVRNIQAGARWDKADWQVPERDLAVVKGEDWLDFALSQGGWVEQAHALYPAVASIIACVGEGLVLDIDEGCEREWDIFVSLMSDPVVANMVTTCFLNKTAAPKAAVKAVGGMVPVNIICWHSDQAVPDALSKKIKTAPLDTAEIVLSDPDTSISSENEILLLNLSERSVPHKVGIGYASDLTKVEACEIYQPEADTALDSLNQKLLSLLTSMRKIPVAVTGDGVLRPLLSRLSTLLAELSANSSVLLGDVLASVELGACAGLVGAENYKPSEHGNVEAAYSLGISLLTELSLEAYNCLQQGSIDAPGLLDVLAVYGMHFPKWTGGPISFLAMLQRNEIDMSSLPADIRLRVEGITTPLKVKAAYALG